MTPDQLRTIREWAQRGCTASTDTLALCAEVERLQAALAECAAWVHSDEHGKPDDFRVCPQQPYRRAGEALGGEEGLPGGGGGE